VKELTGLWRRSSIAWPDGRRDTTTQVHWLQGLSAFGDLRQPEPLRNFQHIHSLSDLSRQDCMRLAQQQGFAGYLTFAGQHFEWTRVIDYQPTGPYLDAGSLRLEADGTLIEVGRELDYVEHWQREAGECESTQTALTDHATPVAAAILCDRARGIKACIVRVGARCIFARERAVPLPQLPSLSECVQGAYTDDAARALVDCEISLANETAAGFCIQASTLPFRLGRLLQIGSQGEWQMLECEGDPMWLEL
jgi:hypothetical protein